jgi:hypothetical protein
MTEAETAVRRFYEPLRTGNSTLVDEILTPDAKTSRCPAISAHAHIERSVFAAKHRQRNSIQQIFGDPRGLGRPGHHTWSRSVMGFPSARATGNPGQALTAVST